MTHPIIKTENYLLVVDDSEIKEGDYWVYICPINGLDYGDNNNPIVKNNLPSLWFEKLHDKENYKKIIYHLPLNNAPILEGVPLLPPLEDEAEKLAKKHGSSIWDKRGRCVFDFMRYKYTEEDLRDAIVQSFLLGMDREHDITEVVDKVIQSLQQPKYPVAVEYEIEVIGVTEDGDNYIE